MTELITPPDHQDPATGAIQLEAQNVSKAKSRFMMLVFASRCAMLESKTLLPPPGWDPSNEPGFAFPIMNNFEAEPGETISIVSSPINTDLRPFFFYAHPDFRGRWNVRIFRQVPHNLLHQPGVI